MSGAKVVRVVTKQEIMANCQDRIEVVQDTIEQWRTLASKYNALHAEEEKAIEKELHSIISLLKREQFNDVQKQCSDQIKALRADMNRIQDEAIAKAELERSMRRRVQHSAETLIKTFTTTNRQIPQELLEIASFSSTVHEKDLIGMNATLSRILTEYTISSVEKENMTPSQIELSKALTEGEKPHTLIDWKLLYNDNIESIKIDHRLDKLLAEITTIENDDVVQPFLHRVALIEKETSPKQRSLLTDSLIFDLATHSNNRKMLDQEIIAMREVRSNLKGLNSQAAKDLMVLFTNAIDAEDISSYKILKDIADELLQNEKKAISSASRREAILKGLAELGYEVKENMVTAWAENGRIVVKKSNEESYGIELGAVEDAARMQVQLVSFNQSTNLSQDVNRETTWCSEFSHLRAVLEQSGTTLHVEKALPIGLKSLKRIVNPTTAVQNRRTKVSIPHTKTHD